jgi:serine/threonine protein kinase
VLIKFVCGSCQARLKIAYEHAGEKIECPECQAALRIPDQEIAGGVVIGGFEIKELIGKGGMGEVYLAHQPSMGRDIALKILPAHLTRNKALVDRFLKEVRNSAQLDHPNIVTAYAAGEDDGIYYMAMGYIRGENLDELLQKGPMDEDKAIGLVRQVAFALRAAWTEHGMIHRDIKPENIIIDHKGNPKILDMGLSKSVHDSAQTATSPDTIMGSPNYMSPEQIDNTDSVDFRADMYSLGTTLYHMLTGLIPFYGGSYIETLKKQSTGQLSDPRTINPEISDSCVFFLERLLAKHPDDRFATWDELIAGLDKVSAGKTDSKHALKTGQSVLVREGPGADHTGPSDTIDLVPKLQTRTGGKPIRKGSPFPALLGLLLILAGVIGGAIYLNNQKNDEEELQGVTAIDTDPDSSDSEPISPPQIPDPIAAQLQASYSEALLFSQANPNAIDESLEKFQQLASAASGTDYAFKIAEQIDRLTRSKESAIQQVIQQLRNQVDNLLLEQKYTEAMTLVDNYSGLYAEETRAGRELVHSRIEREHQKVAAAQEREQQLARIAITRTANKIADHLLDGDVGQAVALLEQTHADMVERVPPESIEQMTALVKDVQGIPETIMQRYASYVGRELDFALKTGQQTLTVKKLNSNNTLTVTKVIRNGDVVLGHSTLSVNYDQLSTKEKLARLAGDSPEMALLRGIIHVESGSLSNARKSFESCGTKVGDLLKLRLDVRLGLAKDPVNSTAPFIRPNNDGHPRFEARPNTGPSGGRNLPGGARNRPADAEPTPTPDKGTSSDATTLKLYN